MRTMTEAEWRAFMSTGTRTGKVATVRADGRPHVAPVWFTFDDEGRIVFTTGAETLKGKALRRDPRVAVCVDDDNPPFSYVMVEGTATLSDDLDDVLRWATRLGARYMGEDLAEAFGKRNAVPGELLVRVTPTKVVAKAGVAD